MVCNLMTDKRQWTETVAILQEGGVPCFALPGEAARALAALVEYHRIKTREVGEVPVFAADRDKARELVAAATAEGRRTLSAPEVYTLLDAYGIPSAAWRSAADEDGAAAAASEIGYPVVLKADAAEIVHKSDMGGVALNIGDETALRTAVAGMRDKFDAADMRFLVQKFIPDGLELILGAKAEKGLGHAVMFGLGGIYVEVLKDVVFNLTPVTTAEAEEMLGGIKGAPLLSGVRGQADGIKGAPLLSGVRGQAGIDRQATVALICRLSQLLTDLPQIAELDFNPTLASAEGVCVVDARISL
jgi:acetyltransferase